MNSKLSQLDKQLIKVLLEPDGKQTSGALAKRLGIPLDYDTEKTQEIGTGTFDFKLYVEIRKFQLAESGYLYLYKKWEDRQCGK